VLAVLSVVVPESFDELPFRNCYWNFGAESLSKLREKVHSSVSTQARKKKVDGVLILTRFNRVTGVIPLIFPNRFNGFSCGETQTPGLERVIDSADDEKCQMENDE
jgi:hypothetical protein